MGSLGKVPIAVRAAGARVVKLLSTDLLDYVLRTWLKEGLQDDTVVLLPQEGGREEAVSIAHLNAEEIDAHVEDALAGRTRVAIRQALPVDPGAFVVAEAAAGELVESDPPPSGLTSPVLSFAQFAIFGVVEDAPPAALAGMRLEGWFETDEAPSGLGEPSVVPRQSRA
jgi:hypothetical protein